MKAEQLLKQVFSSYREGKDAIKAALERLGGHITIFDADLRYEDEYEEAWYDLPGFVYVDKHYNHSACKVTEVYLEDGEVWVKGYDQDGEECDSELGCVDIQDVLYLLKRLEEIESPPPPEGPKYTLFQIIYEHRHGVNTYVAELPDTFQNTSVNNQEDAEDEAIQKIFADLGIDEFEPERGETVEITRVDTSDIKRIQL